MCYADYDYYVNTYHGVVLFANAERYNQAAEKAAGYIDYYTRNRLNSETGSDTIERVKRCSCEIVDAIVLFTECNNEADSENGNVKSEKNHEYSVEYFSKSDSIKAGTGGISMDEYIERIIHRTLTFTGLLYAGGDYDKD